MPTSERMRTGWVVAVIAVTVLAVIVAVHVPRSGHTPPAPPPSSFATYIAPGQIFCLGYDTQNIVTSDASYESNLIGYSQSYPLADIDYLLSYGRSDHVCLPGTSADHYAFDGSVYVDGSGWVEEWTAPNGGRFAYLHLMSGIVGLTAHAITPPTITRIGTRDMTYLAIGHVHSSSNAPGAGTYSGGQRVGWSGWPTSWEYSGGGPPGPGDSHLCLVTDSLASDWFYRVANGLDYHPTPQPKRHHYVFHAKAWNAYRVGHHERLISYLYHKRFSWSASVWTSHQWLKGIRYAGHYYGGKHGYTKIGFAWGDMYEFAWAHRVKIVPYKHRHR